REIRDVFLAISRGHADYGVVPIENSTEGSVTQTCDMFMESELNICSEIFEEIHQNLLARCSLGEVKKIISHPQALAQCRNWLAANAATLEVVETSSTTKAAQIASEEKGTAAIASEAAAATYDLHILEESIEDCPNNLTRFVVLGHGYGKPTGRDRTSIMFSLQHKAGSLAETMLAFRGTGVNLTRIESRPCKTRAWEYTFFVDMEGHAEEPPVSDTLEALQEITHNLVVLGSYPRAERVRPVKPQAELAE
ncbi:MAG: prephenate dehydratase, partial [Planctomycetes bacterium]|nr:prephenate dehydratase [Planctomycetota bacterium]